MSTLTSYLSNSENASIPLTNSFISVYIHNGTSDDLEKFKWAVLPVIYLIAPAYFIHLKYTAYLPALNNLKHAICIFLTKQKALLEKYHDRKCVVNADYL